ncbi:D-alanyl-D-alanine carboxypeptidase family protein [Streptomyces spinoverrucosus]|uniref:D-alanyl-D-alanine carboxypeptidase family protein n=1 Tax=Streptomyces spinoverrucosus TaxID=284043 RepID=UPI00142EE0EF|nr:D-alanyl-D-alanine carboxypeptidase [Streptomyces spinoverrucosus]
MAAAVLCLIVIALTFWLATTPATAMTGAVSIKRTLPGTAAPPTWPATGQASLTIDGYGTQSSPHQAPIPTASTAKIMTAYLLLRRHPLQPGQQGPTFTISAEEAARYHSRLANSESVAPVQAGQRITERQALQALMSMSANNIADEIARWCAPTRTAFLTEMDRTAHQLGMKSTFYTDPSGLNPTTVSTAADQVKLLGAALRLPEFATIAASSYTDFRGTTHHNTSPLLGQDGVFMGKTGTTSEAGKNLVFAAHRYIAGRSRLVIGAVMAQPASDPAAPAAAARSLLSAADHSLVTAPIVRTGEILARLDQRWGPSIPLAAAGELKATGRPGTTATITVTPHTTIPSGTAGGTPTARATITGTTTAITLTPTRPLDHTWYPFSPAPRLIPATKN